MDFLGESSSAGEVEVKFTAVVFHVGLIRVHKSPVFLLAPCAAARLSGNTAIFQPKPQSRACQECFSREKNAVRPCRSEKKAAHYSKWLRVTVVSLWPTIRNTDGLEIDTQDRKGGGGG